MSKLKLIIVFCMICFSSVAQNRFYTKDGKISFNSSTPMEDIVAETNQATTILDIEKKEIAFSVLTTSFKFRSALMEEHFNENYMESPKFPKAKFSGKIVTPIDWKSEKTVIADIKGELTMHGVTKEVGLKARITPGRNNIVAAAEITITPEEFNIAIPLAARDKIAKEITIKIEALYIPYNQ